MQRWYSSHFIVSVLLIIIKSKILIPVVEIHSRDSFHTSLSTYMYKVQVYQPEGVRFILYKTQGNKPFLDPNCMIP